jgi:hypothetical protein
MDNKARVREYFDLMFTALENTTDEVFTFFYDDVVKKIKPSIWQQHWVEGMAYRIAHAIAMRNNLTDAGENAPIALQATSKTVGKLSIGYGANVADSSYTDAGEYALTMYGRRYWFLVKNVIKPTGVVV